MLSTQILLFVLVEWLLFEGCNCLCAVLLFFFCLACLGTTSTNLLFVFILFSYHRLDSLLFFLNIACGPRTALVLLFVIPDHLFVPLLSLLLSAQRTMTDVVTGIQYPLEPSPSEFNEAQSIMSWPVAKSALPIALPRETPASTNGDGDNTFATFRTACKQLLTQFSRRHVETLCANAAQSSQSTGVALKCRLIKSTLIIPTPTDSQEGKTTNRAEDASKMEIKTSVTTLFPQTLETAPVSANSFLFCRAQLFADARSDVPTAEAFSILLTQGAHTSRL